MINLLISVLVLSVLVFIHEMGHFLVAKMCKIAVFEFAIGFGRVLWKKKIGETTYALRAIPLGGFVRMAGDDPTLVENVEHLTDEQRAELASIDRSRWFVTKPLRHRVAVVIAGPLFNWVSAIIMAVASFYEPG
jgi:regulator of sigma E protease